MKIVTSAKAELFLMLIIIIYITEIKKANNAKKAQLRLLKMLKGEKTHYNTFLERWKMRFRPFLKA